MTTPQNVRFAHHHLPVAGTKYNGFTIAYVREGKFIKYAWSLACATDNFSKVEGRKFSTANLEKRFDIINEIAALNDGNSYHSPVGRFGCIHMNEIVDYYDLGTIIADNVIEDMDTFSIKHAAISNMLILSVEDVLLNCE
jgi:hypothetical protein